MLCTESSPEHSPLARSGTSRSDTLTSDNSPPYLLSTVEASIVPGREAPEHHTRDTTMGERADLLQGTLDLLILKTLVLGPLHGWAISKRLGRLSGDVLSVGQGSLYPALYRLEDRGWIEAEWGTSPEGRRAKIYTLTTAGKKQLVAARSEWRTFAGAVERVLEAT